MCVVSAVGDYWKFRVVPEKYPDWEDKFPKDYLKPPVNIGEKPTVYATKQEVDALRRDLEELKQLLRAAKVFDESVGEPDCEADDKVDLIRRMAQVVGVDLEDALK